ncbi:hypothetical protein BCR43DRAFT_447903 [Syncephalastrum racemosum]|uniref:Uncharacterized protein n=1 Tax=Syncephalastrum racemosum TaxID=13706 RepID=A0A1X2H000_SYNRA|nr:hypothetical protein BCR43DRAFT_447903 [Syncephalastrum racemosum]
MAWGCTCQNKIPDCPPYEWPVTVAECQGRTKTCQAGCTDQATREICQNRCTHYFRCHQPGGMKSQLQVENPGQTPTYQLPNSVKRLSAAPVAFDIALTATIIMLATNLAVL